jgi:hypothetical protein
MSSASAARALEIQVELAWMGDAVTFRCPLRAHVQKGAIEVTGVVPSADVKARALKIASDTGHTVVDRITVGRVPQNQFPATPGNQLLRDVNRAVTDVLGRLSGDVKINVERNGCVTVSGMVHSNEDRLQTSQRLRRVNGCCCVVNQLEVPGSPPLSQPARLPSPPQVAEVSPAPPQPEQMPTPVKRPLLSLPPLPAEPKSSEQAPSLPKMVDYTPPSPYSAQRVDVTAASPSPITRTSLNNLAVSPPATSKQVEGPEHLAGRAVREAPVAPLPKAEPLVPVNEASESVRPPKTSVFAPKSEVSPPVSQQVVRPVPAPLPVSPAPSSTSSRSSSPGLFAMLMKRNSKSTEQSAESARPKVSDRPYVTMGTVIIHDEPEAEAPPATLQNQLLQAGGPALKNVTVSTGPKGELKVKMRVANMTDIDPLTTRVLQLPEMQAPNVELSFELEP